MRSYLTTLGSLAAVGVMLAAFSSCGSETPKTTPGSSAGAIDPDLAAAKAALAATPLGKVVSRDLKGAGRFVVASPVADAARLNLGHETAARLHFERHAAALGLNNAAVQGAVFTGWHTLPAGAGVAQFEQRVGEIEVFRARASVLVDSGNHLVSIASTFPAVKSFNKTTVFRQSAEAALAAAYTLHAGVPLGASAVRDQGQAGATAMRNYAIDTAHGALQVQSATAKAVYFPSGNRLEPAYYVEILGRAAGSHVDDARSYVIAAEDGRVLYQSSLTMNDSFSYRVWADPTIANHIPNDGPIADVTPHPTGLPDLKVQTFTAPVLIAMEGFNKNPAGAADPWLDPNATVTWGNNVRAYSDRNQGSGPDAGTNTNDGYQDAGPDGGGGDWRADLTSAKTFDRIFDVTQAPDSSPDQIKAAVTQIFYVTNWLHDYWYDSGFDEKSGNAQLSNYGRGGTEGDPLNAEGQDSADAGQANNANMSAMSDGTSPKMQMYVWTGLPNRTLTFPGAAITDPLGGASFGPQIFDLTGTAVLANDMDTSVPTGGTGTMGTTTDGCQATMPNVAGKIAVVDRGTCNYTVKVGNAQTAGATGIIIINNVAGNVAPNPPGVFTTTIPVIGVSLEDGTKIKTALTATPMVPMVHATRGAEIMRDGTIDNTVVAHEWGHYWHHRLVSCGSSSCGGMSEGWADFDALMMVLRDSDRFDAGQTYALAQYAAQGIAKDGTYFGIRRAPYSRDMTKNPFTFQHIRSMATLPVTAPLAPAGADMSEVHNVGEIWAETLFEAYTNLLDLGRASTPPRTFDESKRRMADYLVAGMKATPNEPTFVEQRDAILSAVYATKRMDDFTAIAKGFAKRGLGVAAVAPPTTSTMLNEAVEDFSFKGNLGFVDAKLDDSVTTCDHDGNLDANEVGKLTVIVRNSGWVTLTKSTVTASSTDANVTFGTSTIVDTSDGGAGDSGTVAMGAIDPFGTATLTIPVTAKAGLAKKSVLPIKITLADPEAATPSADFTVQALVNYDETAMGSATDDVESTGAPVWTMTHTMPPLMVGAWSREVLGTAFNHVWHADDLPSPSDETLVSPDLKVGMTDPFTISFSHRFLFEAGQVTTTTMGNFDGGVLELSDDSGATWKDISTYVDPMYPGTIYSATPAPDDNVLAGRKAWIAQSTGYPNMTDVKLDLGTKVAGKTVKVRFRVATDNGNGTTAVGWDIDNIAFGGITNKPFVAVVDNSGICGGDGGTPTDGGAKDGGGGAGGTGGSTGGGSTTTESSCNCSVPGGHSSSGAAAAGLFGALAMVLRRRRRQQS